LVSIKRAEEEKTQKIGVAQGRLSLSRPPDLQTQQSYERN